MRENYEPDWAKGGENMPRTRDGQTYEGRITIFLRRAGSFYLLDHKHVYIFHYIPQFV